MDNPAQNPSTSPPQNRPDKCLKHLKPAHRCLAGYVLSRETAVKLGYIIRGAIPDPTAVESEDTYWSLGELEDAIRKDLISKGRKYGVAVHLTGTTLPFGTIFATQGSYRFRGSPPEAVEGEKEKVVREWLESKGVGSNEYRWEVRLDELE